MNIRLILLIFAGALVACDATPQPAVLSGHTMGTTYSVALYGSTSELPLSQTQFRIQGILNEIDSIASTYRSDSEVSRFNANETTDWQPVSAEFCGMIERSLEISVATNGAFDITVGPLVDLWGFGSVLRNEELPSDEAIAEALSRVGYSRIDADCTQPAIRKSDALAQLDLSAWAKGHAADRIAAYLKSVGLSNHLVEVGGELQLSGGKAGSDSYRIALEHAASGDELAYEVFALANIGVATSGDYHNFYEVDGQRYSHTIDPRTGHPVTHSLSTVSVVSGSTADADAYATALLVMGPTVGYEFATRHEIAAYMTAYSGDGVETRETPSFSRLAQPVR